MFRPSKYAPKSGPRKQIYCSGICRNMEWEYKHGLKRRVPYGMCKYGRHARTPENTYVDSTGKRCCRDCKNESQRARRAHGRR